MAHFTFRFQTLLRLREADRQQRRFELAQAYEADRLLQQQVDAATTALASAKESSRRAAAPGEVHIDRLLALQRYALTLQSQCRDLRQKQVKVREEVERRRSVLIEADRHVRALEKLRDKHELAFRAEEAKREQKVWDEIGART